MMVQSEGESLGRRPIILGPDVLYIIEDVQSTRLLYGVQAFLIKEHANSFRWSQHQKYEKFSAADRIIQQPALCTR